MNDQEKVGVTHSMISPIPQLFIYDFPLEICTDISSVYNQSLSQLVKETPEKLSAVGTVPLADPDKAAQILNEAMNMGLKGAIIGPGIGQQMLSDPFFKPFFEEANRSKGHPFHSPSIK